MSAAPGRPKPTHLRDARLRHALEHAPDAQAAPAEATRAAILRHAHAAVAPAAATAAAPGPLPWWAPLARWLATARRPWNAGFATVLLASVVAGLWWERDVPGPVPEPAVGTAPAMPAPMPAAPDAAGAGARSASVPAPEHAEERAASPPMAKDRATHGADPPRPQPSTRKSEPAPPAPAALPPADALASPAEPPAAAQGASPAPAPDARTADAATPAPAGERARAAAPRAAPSVTAQVQRAPAAAQAAVAWTALQLRPATGAGRARTSLPAEVQQAIDAMLRTGATGVPGDDPALLQIALLDDGGSELGLLALGSHSLRWTPTAGRLPEAFSARVDPAVSQRVRDALTR